MNMFKAEWKYLFKHKLMLIVIIVIGFIPSIYAVTFLKSMWDPYGKLQDLPVAVVNQDQAVDYQGNHLNVGRQLATNLKKSKGMDFRLVTTPSKAKAGLKNGDYYMVVTIPKNFSHNATTLMNKRPKKMVLHYETSAGHNFTASKMTASAATAAAQSVSDQITKTYAKTLFTSIKQLGTGLTTAGKNNQKLAKGSQAAQQANQKITTGLNTLATSTLTLDNGAQSLNNGLDQYMTGVAQASQGSQQVTTGLDTLLSSSQQLATGVNQLNNGSRQLNSGVQQYTAAAQTISSKTQQYVAGVASADQGAQSLRAGLATLNQRTGSLQSGTQQLATASADLTNGLQALSGGSTELSTNLARMQQALGSNSAQETLTSQLRTLAQTLNQAGSTNQLDGVKGAASQLTSALGEWQAAQQNQQTALQAKVAAAADAQKLTAEQKAAMVAAVADGSGASADGVKTAAARLNTALGNVSAGNVSAQANEQLRAIQGTLTQVATSQRELQSGLAGLSTGAQSLTAQLQRAASGMQSLNQGIVTLQRSTPALSAGVSELSNGASTLASGTGQLTATGQQLTAGTQTFANSGSQLNTGAANLSSGLGTLSNQVPSLTAGVTKLATGSQQVTNGLQTLGQTGTQLTSGAAQLANGTRQLSGGSQQLATGSQQLGTGLGKVQDGNQQLATKLTRAGKQAKVDPTKLTYDQVAKPTTTSHTERDTAKNNGTGMAPYMISVSLFVGALAFNMMFDTYTPRRFPKTGIGWWLSKASVLDGFALFESLLIVSFLIMIDGLAPVHVFATYGMVVCIALAFMSIVYWLNLVLGKVGSFFSMILLVLQLGGSAGTYPIELSNGFFQAIHPWLPMTYAVNGLRETLMIGNSAVSEMVTLFLIALAFSGLCILFFARRHGRVSKMDFEVADGGSSDESMITATSAAGSEMSPDEDTASAPDKPHDSPK